MQMLPFVLLMDAHGCLDGLSALNCLKQMNWSRELDGIRAYRAALLQDKLTSYVALTTSLECPCAFLLTTVLVLDTGNT